MKRLIAIVLSLVFVISYKTDAQVFFDDPLNRLSNYSMFTAIEFQTKFSKRPRDNEDRIRPIMSVDSVSVRSAQTPSNSRIPGQSPPESVNKKQNNIPVYFYFCEGGSLYILNENHEYISFNSHWYEEKDSEHKRTRFYIDVIDTDSSTCSIPIKGRHELYWSDSNTCKLVIISGGVDEPIYDFLLQKSFSNDQ